MSWRREAPLRTRMNQRLAYKAASVLVLTMKMGLGVEVGLRIIIRVFHGAGFDAGFALGFHARFPESRVESHPNLRLAVNPLLKIGCFTVRDSTQIRRGFESRFGSRFVD